MTDNNDRYDLSDRLIHFFRSVDLATADAPPWPEDTGYASVHEDEVLRPAFLLRHAIRMGRLYATWSVRKGRRTIHGKRPSVCFTEMPVAAFIEAGRERQAAGQAMSPYGIVFTKAAAFAVGARPVIYGLTGDAYATGGEDDTPRLLPADTLPLKEQYRYVAFNPSHGKLDWSHEREWRWRLNAKPWVSEDGGPPMQSDDMPGLSLDDPHLRGLGVIVATAAEAEQIIYDVLTKVDRGDIAEDQYAFVLAHETIANWQDLRERHVLEGTIGQNLITLTSYFDADGKTVAKAKGDFRNAVTAVLTNAGEPTWGESGGCWLWLLDNTHAITRALVAAGTVKVNKHGKYLVRMTRFAKAGFNLEEREALTRQLAERLMVQFELRADYFSVLGKQGADDVPFYNGDQLDDHLFYNLNWTPEEVEAATDGPMPPKSPTVA
jgi:hypothetical protein